MKRLLFQCVVAMAASAGCATTGPRPVSASPVSLKSVLTRDMTIVFVVESHSDEAISVCPVAWRATARDGVNRAGVFGAYCGDASTYTRVEPRASAQVTRKVVEAAVSDEGEVVTIELELQMQRGGQAEPLKVRWTGKPR